MRDFAFAVVDTVAALDGAGLGVSVVFERGCRLATETAAVERVPIAVALRQKARTGVVGHDHLHREGVVLVDDEISGALEQGRRVRGRREAMRRRAAQGQSGGYGQDEEGRQRRAWCGDTADGDIRHVPHRIVSSPAWSGNNDEGLAARLR